MILLVWCKQQEHVEIFDREHCDPVITRQEPTGISYHLENTKYCLSVHIGKGKIFKIAQAINRTDSTNSKRDSFGCFW